jgi:hypothetical protein
MMEITRGGMQFWFSVFAGHSNCVLVCSITRPVICLILDSKSLSDTLSSRV